MTLRHTENNVTTTNTANKFLELTVDNTLPVLDASAVTGLPNNEPVVRYTNQSTINLQYNEITMIDNFNFGATTINIPATVNTGDKVIVAITRAGLNNVVLNLPANHKLNYKGSEYLNAFTFDTYLIANVIAKGGSRLHGLMLFQFIAYNDGTNVNWLHYTAATSLEEFEPTLYNNLLDYQTLGVLGTDLNLYAVSPNISYYKIPPTYASTTYSITGQAEFIANYNKTRHVLIIDNANVTSITLPSTTASVYYYFTIVKTSTATQDITINAPNTSYPLHTSNANFGTLPMTYTFSGSRSVSFLASIYWTLYYNIVIGES